MALTPKQRDERDARLFAMLNQCHEAAYIMTEEFINSGGNVVHPWKVSNQFANISRADLFALQRLAFILPAPEIAGEQVPGIKGWFFNIPKKYRESNRLGYTYFQNLALAFAEHPLADEFSLKEFIHET